MTTQITTADIPERSLPAAAQRARLDFIDGLRGLAIVLVFLFHAWQHSGYPVLRWWNPLGYGYAGVNLFLVISGFCLYWPMVKGGGAAVEPSLLEFAARRARRILPPYYAALALFALLPLIMVQLGVGAFATARGTAREIWTTAAFHGLMVHNLMPEHIWQLDGPLWSLPLEINLYMAMPILVVLARRAGIERAVIFAVLVNLAYRACLFLFLGGVTGWRSMPDQFGFVLCYFFLGRWSEFALGMWAASIIARKSHLGLKLPLGWLSIPCFVSAILLARLQTKFGPFSDPLFALGFFLLLLSSARALSTGNRRGATFTQFRPLVLLGTVSYSFYLLHDPLLSVATKAARQFLGRERYLFASSIFLFFPLILAVSVGFYYVVERPFLAKPKKGPSNARSIGHKEAPSGQPSELVADLAAP